jgi:hypothetical protein
MATTADDLIRRHQPARQRKKASLRPDDLLYEKFARKSKGDAVRFGETNGVPDVSRLLSVVNAYSNSLIGSRSSRTYIGRPLPLVNVWAGSMPTAR